MFTAVSMERLQQRMQWLATVLVFLLPLALLVVAPQVMTKSLIPVPWDKLVHLLAFALLAVAVGLASRIKNAWALLPAFVGAVLLGAVDELQQMVQPNRTADWLDFAADVTGAALGCLALVVLAELRDRLVKHPLSDDMD